MGWKRESPIAAVCPDDLGKLEPAVTGFQCLLCARHFTFTDGIVDLLPREDCDSSSAKRLLLDAYRRSFSNRSEKAWHRPLRELVNNLGNAYLYVWAVRTLNKFANGRSLSVLDAACGDGILSRYLSSRHAYVGIDFSIRPLLRARHYNPAAYFRADLSHLPFPDASFDAVLSLQALQYLDRPDVALAQIARVLKPGGLLLLSAPNDESFKYRWQGVPPIQLQRFDRSSLCSLLGHKFEITSVATRGFWVPAPLVSIHAPGVYPIRWGLSWTVVGTPRSHAS